MTAMSHWLAIGLFAVMTVGTGIWHGTHTGRWVPLQPLDAYQERLASLPMNIGTWAGNELAMDDPEELGRAGIVGHLFRKYIDRSTGQSLNVLIVMGRPGKISVHTPDVCYRGLGYTPIGQNEKVTVPLPGRTGTSTWMLRFRPPPSRPDITELEIRWAWISPRGFEAPNNARVSFASDPALFKIYILSDRVPTAKVAGADVNAFLSVLIPEMESRFFKSATN